MSSTSPPFSAQGEKAPQHEPVSVPPSPGERPGEAPDEKQNVKGRKPKIWIVFATMILALQVLFMGMISHLFGSVYDDDKRVDNLHVLFVDYDQGAFGK